VKQKLEKVVPDQPKHTTPVHLRQRQIFADADFWHKGAKPFIPGQKTEASGEKVEAKQAAS
jgi:NADH dehydrogenase (ubiquinone) 1 alpha subcomplex subunit 8